MNEPVTQWIGTQAHPLATLDPHAPHTDLEPLRAMVGAARVVAIGASTRQSHELSTICHRLLRFLVEELGFRSLALEGDDPGRVHLDEYVRAGTGDPRALLAEARPFWRSAEILGVVRWMRAYNERHPTDPVRFAGVAPHLREDAGHDRLDAIERRLAENAIWWHERSNDKLVYWGGIAHTVNGNPRTVSPSSPPQTHRNAGSYLRERFGHGHLSIGVMFHHGALASLAPLAVPAPPTGYAETALAAARPDTYLLDLRTEHPAAVRTWLNAPARTRLIGPHYDPADDAAHHLSGGSLADWFDIVVHTREVSPAQPIDDDSTPQRPVYS